MAALDDEALAALAAREGSDGVAFSALVERFRERVWRVCWRLMGDEHDAQDAAQEVFVRLFFDRAKFAGRSRYSTWLHGVAIRTCLALRRSRSQPFSSSGSSMFLATVRQSNRPACWNAMP